MSRVGRGIGGLVALVALALGCAEAPESEAPIRISAPGFDAENELEGRWDRDGPNQAVTLSAGTRAGAWTSIDVAGADGEPAGSLILGPAAAVLAYHAAASTPPFSESLLPNRLALIDPGPEGAPVQAALWLTRGVRSHGEAIGARLRDLSPEAVAPLLAAAMALGAWDAVALDRFPEDSRGRPRLPPFVPSPPGDWTDLRGTSLEGYLVAELSGYVVETPGLRGETYRILDRMLPELDALARRIEALAASLPDLPAPAGLDAVTASLAEHADALASYLESVWIEQVLTRTDPDVIRMAIHVHTVVPVTIEGFGMSLDVKRALARGDALGRLRLVDQETGSQVAARFGGTELVFPVARDVDPVALGPHRFGSTRLLYRIEGLDHWPELRNRMLEELDVRVVSHDGSRVGGNHVRRIWSIADRRFSAAREETPAEFATSLPERLVAQEGAPPARLARGVLRVGAGPHHLRDDLILPPDLGLHLEAGAEIAVDPGRSILVRGPLRVEGSAERPVRIGRADPSAAWGVLAAQGRGVSRAGDQRPRPRAIVRHLELDGGSEDQLRGVWYTGQLSVYHQDLELRDSTLSRSANQDNLNVVRGDVEISGCRFLDSGDDALDFDWASGSIRRSLFARTGPDGDGIDVAGSTITVEDVVVSDAGDKCISAGERSQVELRGALLRRCDAAIASKDSSRVRVGESLLIDVASGYDAFQKSSIFGPPELLASELIVTGERRPGRLSPGATFESQGLVQVGPAPMLARGMTAIRLPLDGPLGRALTEDAFREVERFDGARFRALRALVPKEARPE